MRGLYRSYWGSNGNYQTQYNILIERVGVGGFAWLTSTIRDIRIYQRWYNDGEIPRGLAKRLGYGWKGNANDLDDQTYNDFCVAMENEMDQTIKKEWERYKKKISPHNK